MLQKKNLKQLIVGMKKKRKKHWTTKNTHLKHLKNRDDDKIKSVSRIEILLAIVGIILAILSILVQALDNDVVAYDNFTGNPTEWIKKLK